MKLKFIICILSSIMCLQGHSQTRTERILGCILAKEKSKDFKQLISIYANPVKGKNDIERKKSYKENCSIAETILSTCDKKKDQELIVMAHLALYSQNYNFGWEGETIEHIRIAYSALDGGLKDSPLGGIVTMHYAECFSNAGQHELAIQFLKEANAILIEVCPESNALIYLNLTHIANIHANYERYAKAESYYTKALKYGGNSGSLFHSSGHNNIGLLHYRQSNFEAALKSFNRAKKILVLEGSEEILFDVNIDENIANLYSKTGMSSEALEILHQVSLTRRKYGEHYEAVRSDIYQLDIVSKMNDPLMFVELISSIDRFYKENAKIIGLYTDPKYERYLKIKLAYYEKVSDHSKYVATTVLCLDYFEKRSAYKKNLIKQTQDNFWEYQLDHFDKKIRLEEEVHLSREQAISNDKWNLTITVSLLAVLVVILLLLVRLKQSKQNRTNLKLTIQGLENDKLSQSLRLKEKDLMDIVMDSRMRTDFHQNILSKIKKNIKDKDPLVRELMRPIIFEFDAQISIEQKLSTLHSDLSQVNAEFDKKLMQICPVLSKTEREICAYIRLRLTIKEIAQIRTSSTSSVKTTRSRIRKKLDLDSSTELDGYIQGI